MVRHELCIDVSDAVPFTDTTLAVTVVIPDNFTGPATFAFGFPGGGYGRGYWDIIWPGGYSEAEFHAERGWLYAALDHLGVGASSMPEPERLTFEIIAAANDAAVRGVVEGLREGSLVSGLPPVEAIRVVGMGQSMGGCLSIVTQANHATFDGLAVLGFSGRHTVLPSPSGGVVVEPVERGIINPEAAAMSSAALSAQDVFAWAFHWDDVEPALLTADLGDGYPMRQGAVPPWASAALPPCAASMLTEGVVAAEAAAIDVPMFAGFGERDVSPDPWLEPAAYRGSADITLAVIPRMAHMHNFAGTRRLLWERLHVWAEGVTPRPPRP